MRILVDTDVALDLLQAREPFAEAARDVFTLAAEGPVEACITAKQAADIHYIASRELHSKAQASELLGKLVRLMTGIDATAEDVYNSLLERRPDFEDGMLIAAAGRAGVGAIVTRDARGFAASGVPTVGPADLRAALIGGNSSPDAPCSRP